MCFLPTDAVVSLEGSTYTVAESHGTVEVCVRVASPSGSCPIRMPFSVSISTRDRTAGSFCVPFSVYLNTVMVVYLHLEVSVIVQC